MRGRMPASSSLAHYLIICVHSGVRLTCVCHNVVKNKAEHLPLILSIFEKALALGVAHFLFIIIIIIIYHP